MNEFVIKNGFISKGNSIVEGGITATTISASTYSNLPSPSITVGTSQLTSGTNGRVLFQSGTTLQQDGAFNWDSTNKRLGIGANATSPSAALFMRTNTIVANDIVTIQNGQYGNEIFKVRDNATASVTTVGSIFLGARMYSSAGVNTNQFDIGGYGLGGSYGDFASNSVWLNNAGNVGDGQGTSTISVSSNFYVNLQTTKKYKFEGVTGHFGIGNVGTLGARLDVRAQGALSTDIAFRVRNSADTLNTFQSTGDGKTRMQGSTYYTEFDPAIGLYVGSNFGNHISLSGILQGTSWFNQGQDGKLAVGKTTANYRLDVNTSTTNTNEAIRVNNANSATDGKIGIAFTNTWTGDAFGSVGGILYMNHQLVGPNNAIQHCRFDFALNSLNTAPSVKVSVTAKSNILIGTPTENLTDSHTIYIVSGTVPTGSITDGYKQYSADIVAGNAAPHFRTENGNIIKLYQQPSVTTSQGIADVLTNLGFISSGSTIDSIDQLQVVLNSQVYS
jgi:hypothetical protein